MSENGVRDVIIIGGGPAGYTAALYAARANLHPLVIEGFQWGGQLMITSDVENYPGYPQGTLGPEMMSDFRTQAERFGTEFVTDDVTKVDFSSHPFHVWVGQEEVTVLGSPQPSSPAAKAKVKSSKLKVALSIQRSAFSPTRHSFLLLLPCYLHRRGTPCAPRGVSQT